MHNRQHKQPQNSSGNHTRNLQALLASVHSARIRVDETILSHQCAFPAVFQVDVVSVEITLGRDHHDLRERAAYRRRAYQTNVNEPAQLQNGTYPLNPTTHRAPLVGSLKNAKSRAGSQSSVSVFGRYPPTDVEIDLVKCIDRRRITEDTLLLFFRSSTNES